MENVPTREKSNPIWKKILCVALVIVVIGVCIPVARLFIMGFHLSHASNAMRQIHEAFQIYANASPGNYYPLRTVEPGIFLPDVDTSTEAVTGKAEIREALKYFSDDARQPLCYLGYAFYDEASAQRFLDQLEKDPQVHRGGGTSLEKEPILDPHSPELEELAPLRIGSGRRFLWAWFVFGGLGASDVQIDSPIPILWKMPENIGERVPVLYLNGMVLFHKYPGEFPMTPLFINRLRGLMGLPQDPGFSMQTPILPVLREILETGSRDPGRKIGALGFFDSQPSVVQGDTKGYRIALGHGEVVLFPETASSDSLDPATLFEAPKHFYQGLPRDIVARDMGTSRGYHWYGNLDYSVFTLLRDTFDFTGGDSLYDAAVIYALNGEPASLWLRPDNMPKEKPTEVLRRPATLEDYLHAFIGDRDSKGNPVENEIVHAAALLCGADYGGYGLYARPDADLVSEAKNRLLSAAEHDPEAAATLLLPHVLQYQGRRSRSEATPERLEILQRLPRDTVLPIVRHLADNLQDTREAELCQDLLNKLK